jgi:hypothetical protein
MGLFKALVFVAISCPLTLEVAAQGLLSSMLYESANSLANPSMIGTTLQGREYSGLTASVNRQWSDNRFALTQSVASYEQAFSKGIGLMASLRNGRYGGFFSENAASIGARYRLVINSDGAFISLGINTMISQSKADFEGASISNAGDPFLTGVFIFSKKLDLISGITWNSGSSGNFSHRGSVSQSSISFWQDDSFRFNNGIFFEYVLMRNTNEAADRQHKLWLLSAKCKYFQNTGAIAELAFDYCPKANSAFRFGLTQQVDLTGAYYNSIAVRMVYMPFNKQNGLFSGGFCQAIMLSKISNIARNMGEYFISYRK